MQALLIKHHPYSLVVPVEIVAEIIGKTSIHQSNFSLNWIVGHFQWRHTRVPLLSVNAILGIDDTKEQDWHQSVVFWPMKGSASKDFFGLRCAGSPRVVQIEDSDSLIPESITDKIENSLCIVKIDNQIAVIPDLQSIATKIFICNT